MHRRKFLTAGAGALGLTTITNAAFSDAVPPSIPGDSITVSDEEELINAIKSASPGDEVVVSAGTYKNVEVEVDVGASEARPFIIRAEEEHSCVFTGTTQFRVTGSHILMSGLRFAHTEAVPQFGVLRLQGAGHCRISNCEFEDLEGMWGTVVIDYGAHDNRIDNNHFADLRYRAVRVGVHEEALEHGPPVRNQIDHNIIRDIPESGGGSAEAIALGSWGYPWNEYETLTIIENNLFLRCNGENEIITVKTRGNVIRNNAFIHCVTGELVLRSTDDTAVEGNRFEYSNHGIRVSGCGHRVVDNVIVNPRHTGIRVTYGSDDLTHPTTYKRVHSTVVAYNTIVNAGDTGIIVGDFKDSTSTNERFKDPPFDHPTGSYTLDVAPYNSVFANNVVAGKCGTLFKIIDSPNNIYAHNLLYAEGDAKIGDRGDHPIFEKPAFRQPEFGEYQIDRTKQGLGDRFPVLPIDQRRPQIVGAKGRLPDVGPSEELVAEVLSYPPVYLDEDLPPSSYHLSLDDKK